MSYEPGFRNKTARPQPRCCSPACAVTLFVVTACITFFARPYERRQPNAPALERSTYLHMSFATQRQSTYCSLGSTSRSWRCGWGMSTYRQPTSIYKRTSPTKKELWRNWHPLERTCVDSDLTTASSPSSPGYRNMSDRPCQEARPTGRSPPDPTYSGIRHIPLYGESYI
jgi:hypothetical protein